MSSTASTAIASLQLVSLEQIQVPEGNPRRRFDERALRELVYRGWTLSKPEGLALANALDYRVITSADQREGPRAFVERRKPQWQGR